MTLPVSTSGSEELVFSGLEEAYRVAVPGRVVDEASKGDRHKPIC
ncbi:hypothetical protein AB0K35_02285 [Micromonospora sp. NPDC053740]